MSNLAETPPEIITHNGVKYRLAAICGSQSEAETQQTRLESKTGYETVQREIEAEHCVYLEEAHNKRRFM